MDFATKSTVHQARLMEFRIKSTVQPVVPRIPALPNTAETLQDRDYPGCEPLRVGCGQLQILPANGIMQKKFDFHSPPPSLFSSSTSPPPPLRLSSFFSAPPPPSSSPFLAQEETQMVPLAMALAEADSRKGKGGVKAKGSRDMASTQGGRGAMGGRRRRTRRIRKKIR